MSRRNLASTVDQFYRHVIGGRVFPAGWGDAGRVKALMEFHKVMSNRDKVQALIDPYPEVTINTAEVHTKFVVHNGYIFSPFAKHCPGLMPDESEVCRFQFIIPRRFKSNDKPVAIHMAGTGDQNFWRRRILLGEPLAVENGIASLILENPFYGSRKPPNQIRSNVRYVSDIFVMGGGLMLESLALLRWLEGEGYGPFCMTGISMGGHMASLGATNYPKPIAIAPCLSWTTASSVFTRGVMTNSINWKVCEATYFDEPYFRSDVLHRLSHYIPEAEGDKAERTTRNASTTNADWTPPLFRRFLQVISDLPKILPLQIKRSILTFPPISSLFNLGNAGKPSPFLSFTTSSSSLPKLKRREVVRERSSFEGSSYFQGDDLTSRSNEKEAEAKLNFYNQEDTPTRREALEFMRRLMDHFTHLSNFEKPIDPELATFITARYDAYVLRDGVRNIQEIWPGCTVRYVDAGHVIAYIKFQEEFRNAICDALRKHQAKYNKDGSIRTTPPEDPCLPIAKISTISSDHPDLPSSTLPSTSRSTVNCVCPIVVPSTQHDLLELIQQFPPNWETFDPKIHTQSSSSSMNDLHP